MKLKSCCFEILSKIEIQVKLYIVHKKKIGSHVKRTVNTQ